MRILHVNKFLYRRGGAESYMEDVAALQEAAGHDVAFFGMDHPENTHTEYRDHFPSQVELDDPPSGALAQAKIAGRMVWSRSASTGIAAVVDDFRPDVVHHHNIYHQLSPSVLRPLRKRGIPSVMTLHDYKLACPNYQLLAGGEVCDACIPRKFWNAPRKRCKGGSLASSALVGAELGIHTLFGAYDPIGVFICPSEFMARTMRRTGIDDQRLAVLRHPIDGDSFGAPKATPGGPFAYVGRLGHEKGLPTLLEALALVPEAELVVAGDGAERDKLEARANRPDLAGRVRFLGRVDRSAVGELLRSSTAAVLAAEWHENQPMSILEAHAIGVPMVVTSLGGLRELVDHETTGMVVEPGNPADLAAALRRLHGDPAFAFDLGRAARERVRRDFSIEAHLAGLDELYARAAA